MASIFEGSDLTLRNKEISLNVNGGEKKHIDSSPNNDMEQQQNNTDSKTEDDFPTEPAFTVPVKISKMNQYGDGHYGIVALETIPAGTKFWTWTDRVAMIHHSELEEYLENKASDMKGFKLENKRIILRQGFVLPKETSLDFFCSNPTDAGRFMNHANDPNCGPDGTLREIQAGEEMTMDYGFHGNPKWYQDICHKYNVLTEAEVARQARA